MYKTPRPRRRGKAGHVTDVHFMEIEFDAPRDTRMVIELSGGLRLLAADVINFLRRPGQKGGKR